MRTVVIATLAVLALHGCSRESTPLQFDGPTMGTTYSITVTRAPDGVRRNALQVAIDEVLGEVDQHLSTWNPRSEISAFNARRSTTPVEASPQLLSVVAISREVSEATGGAFDITVGPLVRAWGFGADDERGTAPPDPASLRLIEERIGYEKLILSAGGRTLQKAVPALEIDVAGVAPGYAVDQIAGRFEGLGVRDYLIELGGELRGRGRSPAGRPWRVAVEVPRTGERTPYALVELDGMSVSTSGDYRDFRMIEGRRVSHTLDPRTGAPVKHELASVCVLHPSDAHADAYATALMVLGPEEGMALARRLKLAALFIERDVSGEGFREQSTPEFERLRRPLE